MPNLSAQDDAQTPPEGGANGSKAGPPQKQPAFIFFLPSTAGKASSDVNHSSSVTNPDDEACGIRPAHRDRGNATRTRSDPTVGPWRRAVSPPLCEEAAPPQELHMETRRQATPLPLLNENKRDRGETCPPSIKKERKLAFFYSRLKINDLKLCMDIC